MNATRPEDTVEGWDEFLRRARATFDSPYESDFAQQVLRRVPGLSPRHVRPQQGFRDAQGRSYRMDFAIVEEPFVHIALEVDGYDKTGRGSGMTRTEFENFLARQAELTAQGWHVLRFANSRFARNPDESVRFIELTLREARSVARDRELAKASPRTPAIISTVEQAELKRLREEAQAESQELRGALASSEQRAASREAENSRMARVAIGLGIVFAAALIAVALVARGPASSTPAPGPQATSPVGTTCPVGYSIKGNINDTGSRIYHVPGGDFYNTTIPERCFATEAAAQTEGFRRSLR